MPGPTSDKSPEAATPHGVLDNCRLGLKVLGTELKWLLTGIIRRYESRQVSRRLEAEYVALGKLACEHLASKGKKPLSADGEAGVALAQIDFLKTEIAILDKDLSTTRQEMLQRRKADLGLDNDE